MPNPILKRFTVSGAGAFPLDMLRVDQCWPASSGDAACIGDAPTLTGFRAVMLETSAKYAPNRQRWRSSGWRVAD